MEEVGLPERHQGIDFSPRGRHQAMVRHHFHRHLRGLGGWVARPTGHVVSVLPFRCRDLAFTYMRLEGYLVLGRVGVDEDFCGIKSSAALAWSVCGPNSCLFYISLENFLAGQVCHEWQPWGQYLGISSILGQSLLHSLAYVLLSVRPPSQFDSFFHFLLSSDGFRSQRSGLGSLICPLVSHKLVNAYDGLVDCERQRFPYRK
jgi:hypothetical protein